MRLITIHIDQTDVMTHINMGATPEKPKCLKDQGLGADQALMEFRGNVLFPGSWEQCQPSPPPTPSVQKQKQKLQL